MLCNGSWNARDSHGYCEGLGVDQLMVCSLDADVTNPLSRFAESQKHIEGLGQLRGLMVPGCASPALASNNSADARSRRHLKTRRNVEKSTVYSLLHVGGSLLFLVIRSPLPFACENGSPPTLYPKPPFLGKEPTFYPNPAFLGKGPLT